MKKVIVLSSVIVLSVVGVAFKSLSKENKASGVRIEQKDASTARNNDISAKEHSGWD